MIDIEKLTEDARLARAAILTMTTLSASGHPGGSMSSIDFLLALYRRVNVDPQNPHKGDRDRVVVSNGHISPAVYSTLGLNRFIDLDDAITQFRLAGSMFEGHVEPVVPGIEWGTGNLGQGLSAGVGFALASKLNKLDSHVFVLMGDGEQQKGQIAEARRFAIKYRLNNITAIIDYNQLQIGGDIHQIMPQNIRAGYESDGWSVIEIDGHDFQQIDQAITDAMQSEKPVAIMAHTVMGKGVSFMENQAKYHGSTLSDQQYDDACKELGIENRLEHYRKLRSECDPCYEHPKHPDMKLDPGTPRIYEGKTDNRSAWGNALTDLAEANGGENAPMAVFDCDLQGSVKTNGFEKIAPNRFFQGGIMEHNTATLAGAVSKCGIQSYFADFGVFGVDETYNQHRLNDINETNLKLVTTHVGLDVGEDGKTHQCIDYLGAMRNLFHFKVIVPADPNQTDRAIRYISGRYGNFLVPMGRSKLEPIRDADGKLVFGADYRFEYGKADLLRDGNDGAILVMGTLAGNAVEAADILKDKGVSLQVWNIACPCDLDEEALTRAAKTGAIFTVEDHNVHTGLGACVAVKLIDINLHCQLERFGVEDYCISGSADDVYRYAGLDAQSIAKRIEEKLAQ